MPSEHILLKVSDNYVISTLIEILYSKELINEATMNAIQEKLQQKEIAQLTNNNFPDTIGLKEESI